MKGYADDLDALLIAEPSYPSLVYAHKGSMDFRITSKGRSSHSSMPFLGKMQSNHFLNLSKI